MSRCNTMRFSSTLIVIWSIFSHDTHNRHGIACSLQWDMWCFVNSKCVGRGGQNAYELLTLGALKISMFHKKIIFQCMSKVFCVEFQRYPLKFHTIYLTHTLKDMHFIHRLPVQRLTGASLGGTCISIHSAGRYLILKSHQDLEGVRFYVKIFILL